MRERWVNDGRGTLKIQTETYVDEYLTGCFEDCEIKLEEKW